MRASFICLAGLAFAAQAVQGQQANGPNRVTQTASGTEDGIAPSPTESTGCILHVDHWHCSGKADGADETDDDASSDEVISDTGGEGCVQHGTHYHCPAGVSAPCTAHLDDYDLGLHIGALFVLLVASGLGVLTPVMLKDAAVKNSKVAGLFFILKHFGSGVIISTAFIHLLMHAFVMWANECLGHLEYEAVAPAIAMASLMVVFAVDFLTTRAMHQRDAAAAAGGVGVGSEVHGLPHSNSEASSAEAGGCHTPDAKCGEALGHNHSFEDGALAMDGADKRAHWDVHMLEAGIVFHSIMIGVTLGAQGGSGFVPTFCAIVFHQLFEGLGLGSRIGLLQYPNGGAWQRWLMCFVYTIITPLGIAIGIGVRSSFNLSGRSTILAIGTLDSIAAGILLYAGVAQLLVGEWLTGDLRRASRKRVVVGASSLFLGLFSMSVIGKWA